MKAKKSYSIGIIGCGNMGTAMAALLSRQGTVYGYDVQKERLDCFKKQVPKVKACSLSDLIAKSRFIILAVKPQDMDHVLREICACLKNVRIQDKVFVSIAAGISLDFLLRRLPNQAAAVRTMPNLGLKVGCSFTAVTFMRSVRSSVQTDIKRIFSSMGDVLVVGEEVIDKITAVSGSGPGYIFYFLQAMQEAAEQLGFDAATAHKMVNATARGAIRLLETDKASFEQWKNRVCSKGGTTERALSYLSENKFEQLIAEAVRLAYERARELNT